VGKALNYFNPGMIDKADKKELDKSWLYTSLVMEA
jgi:hypothetical protein